MKTNIIEGGAQGQSGGHQSPPIAGAAWRTDVSPSSELSDGRGVAARREGNILAEAGKYSGSLSPVIGVQSWAPSPCVADGRFEVARRDRVPSATAAAALTAAAARGRGESRCGGGAARGKRLLNP